VDDGDCEKGADGGGAGSASVEAEHEIRRGSFGYVVLAVRRRAQVLVLEKARGLRAERYARPLRQRDRIGLEILGDP
jgi:hypothetical protein